MTTEELIVRLARSASPVRLLPRPSLRLARWAGGALPVAACGILAVGPREDLSTAIQQPLFAGLALAILASAVFSSAAALVLSVPGAERSPLQRVMPLMGGGVWAGMLIALLFNGGNGMRRVLAFPFHSACAIEIAGLAMVPGWALFIMLRRAAPLQHTWSAALAALAAVSLAAVATQFICPIDDPAHLIVGHVLPLALLVVVGTVTGRRWLASSALRSAGVSIPESR